MHVTMVWWDLDGTAQTIESLRDYLRDEAVDAFEKVPGLRLKLWVADPENNRWGSILVWESPEAAARPNPARAAQLIGRPPTRRMVFDLEAAVEGAFDEPQLGRRGAAYED